MNFDLSMRIRWLITKAKQKESEKKLLSVVRSYTKPENLKEIRSVNFGNSSFLSKTAGEKPRNVRAVASTKVADT